MFSLLGATNKTLATSWSKFFTNLGLSTTGDNGDIYQVLNDVFNILSIVLWVVLGLVGAIGAIYAIYLGVKLARADEQGKRDEAKKHLITVAIAVGVTVVLILFFNTFLPMILSVVGLNESQWENVGSGGNAGGSGGNAGGSGGNQDQAVL